MSVDEPEIIESPLSTDVEFDGHLFRVEIYESDPNAWILEVVDEENASMVWDEQFESDEAALAEFHRYMEKHGAKGILETPTVGAA